MIRLEPVAALCRATDSDNLLLALRRVGEYVALRFWAMVMNCLPVELNLETGRLMGRAWWWLKPAHRARALDNLRAALGERYDAAELERIARASFEHVAQLYLVELAMMPRLVTEWSWSRYVELGDLAPALRLLLARRGCILITGHFGNYELLGYTISRLGLPLTAVMRPLDNPLVNEFLISSRARGGLTLLMKRGVTEQAAATVARGAPLCFIADQDAGRKGLFVEFFGRPASTYKSIGLLAMAQRVPIVVGYAVRLGRRMKYRVAIERIITPGEWEPQPDPLRWITQEFSWALEAAIRRWPEQYLWVHRRWKHQPRTPRATAARGAAGI